jgi:hypothetical protein
MKFLKVDNWDKLLEPDPKGIQRNICDYIMFMRSKNLAPKSIVLYVAAIRKFYVSVITLILIPLFLRSEIASTIGFALMIVEGFNGSIHESTLILVEENRSSVLLLISSIPYMTSVFSGG